MAPQHPVAVVLCHSCRAVTLRPVAAADISSSSTGVGMLALIVRITAAWSAHGVACRTGTCWHAHTARRCYERLAFYGFGRRDDSQTQQLQVGCLLLYAAAACCVTQSRLVWLRAVVKNEHQMSMCCCGSWDDATCVPNCISEMCLKWAALHSRCVLQADIQTTADVQLSTLCVCDGAWLQAPLAQPTVPVQAVLHSINPAAGAAAGGALTFSVVDAASAHVPAAWQAPQPWMQVSRDLLCLHACN